MNGRSVMWLTTLADYVPPLTFVSGLGLSSWPPRERQRRRALQSVANSLCNVVAADRRYPNEVRLNHPAGGRLVIDILNRRCTCENTDVAGIGLADRLGQWFHGQLDSAQIPEDRISCARVEVEYTAAERTYLASGRVWEMHFSLRSEIATPEETYIGSTPSCVAAVPYGVGALVAW